MHKTIEALVAALLVAALAGCRQDMQNQPKMYPQRSTSLFEDGRSVRTQVPGTVARSQGNQDAYLLTGFVDGKEGDVMPFPATRAVMARGQERYNVYCSPCHSRVGNGMGMIVQRGYYPAANFHSERLREAPLGHFFDVITNGHGSMPTYAAELVPEDRWAIAAYIRALQLSQDAQQSDVAPGAQIESLQEVALRIGLPESFAGSWNVAAPPQPPAPPKQEAPVQAANAASVPSPQQPGQPAANAAQKGKAVQASQPGTSPAEAKKPVAVATGDAAAGKLVYQQHCQMCHQEARTGLPPAIPPLIGIVDRVGAQHIREVVGTGFPTATPPMPAFTDLTPEDLDNLIAFLRTGK